MSDVEQIVNTCTTLLNEKIDEEEKRMKKDKEDEAPVASEAPAEDGGEAKEEKENLYFPW